jgi:hypothetical protein
MTNGYRLSGQRAAGEGNTHLIHTIPSVGKCSNLTGQVGRFSYTGDGNRNLIHTCGGAGTVTFTLVRTYELDTDFITPTPG